MSPIGRGVLLAALAALAFGVTTPLVAWGGRGVGSFATAALLYLGAALAAGLLRAIERRAEAPLRRADLPRVAAVAVVGGAVAPTLLAWGLQRSGPTVGALLLNLEAVFTVLLARAFFREPIGARAGLAIAAMVGGGIALALALDAGGGARWGLLGVLAVAGATLAWAADNTLSRPLAERDPREVVAGKGGLGALLTAAAALAAGEAWPRWPAALVLLGCGATGYGLSLRLYLLAQRRIGAARTGSVFALAPFIGAALGFLLGDRAAGAGAGAIAAAALFALGVYLHVTERHAHAHVHAPLEHDHLHRHPDAHHDHAHDPPFVGEHAHPHRHARLAHAHEHAPDVHHDHSH